MPGKASTGARSAASGARSRETFDTALFLRVKADRRRVARHVANDAAETRTKGTMPEADDQARQQVEQRGSAE